MLRGWNQEQRRGSRGRALLNRALEPLSGNPGKVFTLWLPLRKTECPRGGVVVVGTVHLRGSFSTF